MENSQVWMELNGEAYLKEHWTNLKMTPKNWIQHWMFEQEYSISLNDKNGRDAASSILTTVREENNAQLAFAPYYYFTSSIYEGECTDSQVALMTAKNSDTSLYLTKINGRQLYELVNKYLICRKDSSRQHRKII